MPQSRTIQIVLDPDLLKAADRAAKRMKRNRSAFIRDALHTHLHQLRVLDLEDQDRRGYESMSTPSEATKWEAEAAWPER
jgi:metal-responsive CopG/Arc/MetJ family transcriptional regulator